MDFFSDEQTDLDDASSTVGHQRDDNWLLSQMSKTNQTLTSVHDSTQRVVTLDVHSRHEQTEQPDSSDRREQTEQPDSSDRREREASGLDRERSHLLRDSGGATTNADLESRVISPQHAESSATVVDPDAANIMQNLLDESSCFDLESFKKPLSLIESTENPIMARNHTADILRVDGHNVAGSVLTETGLLVRNSRRCPSSFRMDSALGLQQSLPKKMVRERRSQKNTNKKMRFASPATPLYNAALGTGTRSLCLASENDIEVRRRAIQVLDRDLSHFVSLIGKNQSPTMNDGARNRFYEIRYALRNLGCGNFANFLLPDTILYAESTTTTTSLASGENSPPLPLKIVFALLQLLYTAGGKSVRYRSSDSAVFVPPLLGEPLQEREAYIWRSINQLVHFSDNRSVFEFDRVRQQQQRQQRQRRQKKNTGGADDEPVQVMLLSGKTLEQIEASSMFRIVHRLDRYWTSATLSPLQLLNLQRVYPFLWRALCDDDVWPTLNERHFVMLARILDAIMLPFLEFALSEALFVRQSLPSAIKCCHEKLSAFEAALVDHIIDSSAETYEVFWFSSDVVQFESRIDMLATLQRSERDAQGSIINAPLARLRACLQQCAKMHRVSIVRIIDQLHEVHDRNMIASLQPLLERDWKEWCDEARHEHSPPLSAHDLILGCPYTLTMRWLNRNTGLSAAQREMVAQNIGALQRRISASLDEARQPVHRLMIENGLAVDDTVASHKVPLPILVCYERVQPLSHESDIDYSSVSVGDSNVFRAYGVFLYTRSPRQSPSRFAVMMWLSPPFAGETVVAFTPFCQGLIDHYISRSDRTSAPGYNGLKYYSMLERTFVPIARILGRRLPAHSAGVINRMRNALALEMRRNANLRQVKSLKLPKPPPVNKSRDSHYLAYQVNDDSHNGVWRNYVHPGAAARLWDLGYVAAFDALKKSLLDSLHGSDSSAAATRLLANVSEQLATTTRERRAASLKLERQGSMAILSTWRQNFFDAHEQIETGVHQRSNSARASRARLRSKKKKRKRSLQRSLPASTQTLEARVAVALPGHALQIPERSPRVKTTRNKETGGKTSQNKLLAYFSKSTSTSTSTSTSSSSHPPHRKRTSISSKTLATLFGSLPLK